jgi:acyl-coenzyme A thioesterase PaaI-like protein
MGESIRSKLLRYQFNLLPAFRRTGGRVTYIASDLKTVRLMVPLNWRTRNYVGTIFGGSMFGAVDPIYMAMFIKLLGPQYIVWDKAASIHYKRQGRSRLRAEFNVDEAELDTIRRELDAEASVTRSYQVDLTDQENLVCATIDKTLFFRKRRGTAPA